MSRSIRTNVIRLLSVVLVAIALAVPASAQSQPGRAQPQELQSYLFQVALLIADREGSSDLAALPKNTRKAIADIQDFLPFSSYTLLDVSVIRSNAHGRGLINGPNGEDYQIEFDFRTDSESGQLMIHSFTLREKGEDVTPTASTGGDGESHNYAPKAARDRNLVASSFSVLPGETIVVGSSKLEGGSTALVVLLTAIP